MSENMDPQWERETISKLAMSALQEQRRSRRWGIFFKLITVIYIGVFLFALFGLGSTAGTQVLRNQQHTALVELDGVIAAGQMASADYVISGLRSAFENDHSVAVILRVNSPGGSPVQAAYINDEIKRLRALYPQKPIYAVISDVCASGGIYAASAADEIYANKASIVGSIGVRMDGFGFVGTMEKLGVERRLMTAGEHKAVLDPFSPEDPYERKHVQAMLNEIHQQFIDVVKEGRGDRLKDNPQLYTGLFWTGEKALQLGLVDGLASAGQVARDIIGQETIVDYTYQPDFLQRFSEQLGAKIISQFESRTQGVTLR